MITSAKDDLSRFHEFIGSLLTKTPRMTACEAIDAWYESQLGPDEASLAAIKQGLAEMEAGDHGREVEEVVAELRARIRKR